MNDIIYHINILNNTFSITKLNVSKCLNGCEIILLTDYRNNPAGWTMKKQFNKLNKHIWLDSSTFGQVSYTGFFEDTNVVYQSYLNDSLEELVKQTSGKVTEEKPFVVKVNKEIEELVENAKT